MITRIIPICVCFSMNMLFLFAQDAPIKLGTSSNAFSVLTTGQNQVYVNDDLDVIGFIHRQDASLWGGSSGQLRLDISYDGGLTFQSDIGVINPLNQQVSRYPQLTAYNLSGNTDPFQLKWIWSAPTLSGSGSEWQGNANGVATISAESELKLSENYQFNDNNVYLTTGLCEGRSGEFWKASLEYEINKYTGSVLILKGTLNQNEVIWEIKDKVDLDVRITPNTGFINIVETNIAFSPDGEIGWVSVLGDLNGGQDGVLSPILLSSTDGGETWGSPIEVQMGETEYFGDSASLKIELQGIYIDSILGVPWSLGIPSCGFDTDLIVDKFGRPHFFSLVGSAAVTTNPEPSYSIYSGLPMLAIDFTTADQGLSWQAVKISEINTLRGVFGLPSPVAQDNYPQISRNSEGSKIFYSWVDTDTVNLSIVEGNQSPNLVIAGMDLELQALTCPKWVSKGDILFHNSILFPTMSPIVLTDNEGTYHLPIVVTRGQTEDLYASCDFWYMGNEAIISPDEFILPITFPSDCEVECIGATITSSYLYEQNNNEFQFTAIHSDSLGETLTYFWDFGDDNFSEEENPEHTYNESGSYNVCFSVSNGCAANKVCQTVEAVVSSLAEIPNALSIVYPNPTHDVLNIETSNNTEFHLALINVSGQKIFEKQLYGRYNQIDVRNFTPGIYWCNLWNAETNEVFKIIID